MQNVNSCSQEMRISRLQVSTELPFFILSIYFPMARLLDDLVIEASVCFGEAMCRLLSLG
jgi:hypothetical protein